MDSENACFRFTVLLLVCLNLAPNSFFVAHLSALQPAMAKVSNCTPGHEVSITSCCADCLGIGDDNFNLMFSFLYISSIVTVLIGGWLMDRFGNWLIIVFSLCSLLSYCIVALASSMRGSDMMVPLLMTGSFVFGCGFMPTVAARSRFIGIWFEGKEMRLAFGIATSINRAAAIPSFLLTERLHQAIGLQLTLWLCALLGCVGVACAVFLTVMDARASSKIHQKLQQQPKQQQRSVTVCDLCKAGTEFWLLVPTAAIGSGNAFLFAENSVELVHDKFGFDKISAGQVAGVLEYFGILLAPAVGFFVDKYGRASLFLTFACFLQLPGLLLLSQTQLHPVLGTILMGMSISALFATGSGSVPQTVDKSILAMATAVVLSLRCVVSVLGHAGVAGVVGRRDEILSKSELQLKWKHAIWVMLALATTSFILAISLCAVSWKTAGPLTAARQHQPRDYEEITEEKDPEGEEEKRGLQESAR